MTIRTFWTIFIKIIGVWLTIDGIKLLPQFFSALLYADRDNGVQLMVTSFLLLTATIILYFLVLRLFLFRTSWLVDKLNLTEGFIEEKIDINISTPTVLRLAILIIGGLTLVDSLPTLCQQIFTFFQVKSSTDELRNYSWIFLNLTKVLIGFFLLTRNKTVVNFITTKTVDS